MTALTVRNLCHVHFSDHVPSVYFCARSLCFADSRVCVSGIIKAGNPAVICPMVTGSSVVCKRFLNFTLQTNC